MCFDFHIIINLLILLGNEDDLEYYVRECGDILGVTPKLAQNQKSAKNVLEYIFKELVEYKKLNRVSDSLKLVDSFVTSLLHCLIRLHLLTQTDPFVIVLNKPSLARPSCQGHYSSIHIQPREPVFYIPVSIVQQLFLFTHMLA